MTLGTKLTLLGLAVLIVAAPRAICAKEIAETSKLAVPLLRAGSDDDITGTADFRSSKGNSRFRVRIKNGPASHALHIIVGGVNRGSVMTSSKGSATVQFQTGTVMGKSRELDFDPRGREIEIEDVGDDKLLTSDTGDDSHPPGTAIDERTNLASTGVQPGASGHATFRERKGEQEFTVEIEDVTDGVYDLFVDGVLQGTITVVAGRGEIDFSNNLDFDPFGKLIQVSQSGAVILTGTLLAGAPGVNVCTPAETDTALTNTGLDPDASGHAKLKVGDDCEREFDVEIEDLPVGDYDLVVAGVVRGTISVVSTLDGTEGEIEFSSDSDDPDELPLDFDPAGATIEIKQGPNVFLTATAGAPNPGTCDAVDTELDLIGSGADANAKGKSRFRQDVNCDRDFRVEVENLPVGSYELAVGSIVRGSIAVTIVNSEEFGEIEFDNEPDRPGELLLDFDPRGQLVEVRQGATVFLSVTMPN